MCVGFGEQPADRFVTWTENLKVLGFDSHIVAMDIFLNEHFSQAWSLKLYFSTLWLVGLLAP